jgi:hypothetical protein
MAKKRQRKISIDAKVYSAYGAKSAMRIIGARLKKGQCRVFLTNGRSKAKAKALCVCKKKWTKRASWGRGSLVLSVKEDAIISQESMSRCFRK